VRDVDDVAQRDGRGGGRAQTDREVGEPAVEWFLDARRKGERERHHRCDREQAPDRDAGRRTRADQRQDDHRSGRGRGEREADPGERRPRSARDEPPAPHDEDGKADDQREPEIVDPAPTGIENAEE
jgi:hypothetical protein